MGSEFNVEADEPKNKYISSYIFYKIVNPKNQGMIMPSERTLSDYFDTTGREGILTGGIKMIPIQTPFGE